jgi:hypothetical protein
MLSVAFFIDMLTVVMLSVVLLIVVVPTSFQMKLGQNSENPKS